MADPTPLPSPVPTPRRNRQGVTKRIGGTTSSMTDGLTPDELRERVDVWHGDRTTLTIEGRIEQYGKFARGTIAHDRPMTTQQKVARGLVYLLLVALTFQTLSVIYWILTR
jgi:hypothetical protein